jgi:hypothetical protein
LPRSVTPLKHQRLATEDQRNQRNSPATAPMVLQKCIATSDIGYSKDRECFVILTAKLSDLENDYVQFVQFILQEDLQFDVVDILGDLKQLQLATNPRDYSSMVGTTESLIGVYPKVATTRIFRLSAYIGNEDVHGDGLLRLIRRNPQRERTVIAVGRVQIEQEVRRKGGREVWINEYTRLRVGG